jgi:hypothetical protein
MLPNVRTVEITKLKTYMTGTSFRQQVEAMLAHWDAQLERVCFEQWVVGGKTTLKINEK